jgi:plastocyanin
MAGATNRGRSLMKRITLALGVALAALVVAAPVAARPAAATATTVTVTMTEFKFIFSKMRVPRGTVTFKLVNKGKLPHDLAIAGKKSKLIRAGKTGFFTVTLPAGTIAYKCAVAGHAAAGMKGKLTVTPPLPKLVATTGPGLTIVLKRNGVKVKTLKPGKYALVVMDKSSSHNFRINGPGLNRAVTSVAFIGTKTITIVLRVGKYTFQCDPHALSGMRSTFRVTA